MKLRIDGWPWLVLLPSVALNGLGITWGLPSVHGWAADELVPYQVSEGMQLAFSNGWYRRYPPVHFYLLALIQGAIHAAERMHLTSSDPAASYAWAFLLSRCLSVAMAGGVVALVYACGRRLGGRPVGLWAAFTVAVFPPFVYYAKMANVEVPHLFWFLLSLYFYLRLFEGHTWADYLGFSTAATLAVCTKDQAYGLYLLPAVAILVDCLGERQHRSERIGRLFTAGAWAGIFFLALHNVAFNRTGFLEHVKLITGWASQSYQTFPNTPGGHWGLLKQTVAHLGFVMGWPLFVAGLGGCVLALSGPHRRSWARALLPGLSYYAFFLSVVLYSYDRFVLPLAILLALAAGLLLSFALAPGGRARWLRQCLVAAAFLYALANALSIDLLMMRDSRYAAELWLAEHTTPTDRIAVFGQLEYLPRMDDRRKHVAVSGRRLLRARPDYVVINADEARADDDERNRAVYEGLDRGELGYRLAFSSRSNAIPGLLDPHRLPSDVDTNLSKISPEIRVYAH